ncbi:tyrosine-protein phosphatase [Gordonia paraffinivorans]|uniref:tyrosine-protein phosphatase n=1 Tax=Gordonia paraffinivorans TaxID=175628 RepID=UPI0027E02545|nr:tyrosine-protein phosphatase [Gordonia paraffinivorans]
MTESDQVAGPAERRIPIPGTANLRDVGGYLTTDGSEVARRRLYRAEAIVDPGGPSSYSFYDPEHDAHYRRLELRTVIDLRAEPEIAGAPTAWARATGARLHEFPIAEGGEGADTNYLKMLLTGELERFDAAAMGRFYIDLLEHCADTWGAAYRVLAEVSNLPALVHCAAGKDRTGVFVALVLSSLGVPDDVVAQDYSLTEVYRPDRLQAYADRFVAAGRDPEIGRALFESPYQAMITMLDHLSGSYGGALGYLRSRAGVDGETSERFRRAMLAS